MFYGDQQFSFTFALCHGRIQPVSSTDGRAYYR